MKFLLTGDIHSRVDQPIAIKTDYIEYQTKVFQWLDNLAKEYQAQILCSGDVVHKANNRFTNELAHFLMDNMPIMIGIAGNHDEPNHSLELMKNATLSQVIRQGKYYFIDDEIELRLNNHAKETYAIIKEYLDNEGISLHGFSFGKQITIPTELTKTNIAIYHGMVLDKKSKFLKGHDASILFKSFPEYELILTGDNHKKFIRKEKGRYLVNPGSLFVDDLSQNNYQPSVYLYDTDDRSLEEINVPLFDLEWNEDHIDDQKKKKDFSAFVNVVNKDYDVKLDFKQTMENIITTNNIETNVTNEIRNSFGEV